MFPFPFSSNEVGRQRHDTWERWDVSSKWSAVQRWTQLVVQLLIFVYLVIRAADWNTGLLRSWENITQETDTIAFPWMILQELWLELRPLTAVYKQNTHNLNMTWNETFLPCLLVPIISQVFRSLKHNCTVTVSLIFSRFMFNLMITWTWGICWQTFFSHKGQQLS